MEGVSVRSATEPFAGREILVASWAPPPECLARSPHNRFRVVRCGKARGLPIVVGRPCGRKRSKRSETDPTWASDPGEPTAREERHPLAIVHSLTRNPYCS